MAKVEIHAWYRQYRKLKEQAADAVLLFRFGDFYETFDDDAKLVAELLDVTLTRKDYAVDKSRPKDSQKLYAPMAGMPYHAVERYVSDLVGRGYRVAIAEQITETEANRTDTRPRSVFAAGLQQVAPGEIERKMVHREIVRVITPGTVVDLSMLAAAVNNYLAAAIVEDGAVGLAYADLSTGEFACAEFTGERAAVQLQGELSRLQAAEVLVPDAEGLRLPHLAPAEARLTQDLAPMTKGERELLLPHERVARRLDSQSDARWARGHVTAWPAWRWDLAEAREVLVRQLKVGSLAAFGLDGRPLAARAAGALLQYVHETQRHQAPQLNTLRVYATSSFMFLDPQTRRNLELLEPGRQGGKTALVNVLDRTRTPMGARLLRRWLAQPLLDLEPLQARQEAVAHLVEDAILRAEVREALAQVGDMERAINRIAQGAAVATPRDLVQLRASLRAAPTVIAAAGDALGALLPDEGQVGQGDGGTGGRGDRGTRGQDDDDLFAEDDSFAAVPDPQALNPEPSLDPCADLLELLERALDDDPPALLGASNYLRSVEEGGERPRRVIRPGFEPRMDERIRLSRHAQDYIDRLEGKERERTGIKTLKVGYNGVFGYFIELSRTTDERLIPKDYERKQTLVGVERYITRQMKEWESVINEAKLQLAELEREAFTRICEQVGAAVARLRRLAQALGRLDTVASLAEAAVRGRYTRPTLDDSARLQIVGGRHPVVERVIEGEFVPNDLTLDTDDEQLLIVTGPNMAGKCVSGETLIFSEHGLVPLAELMPAHAREGEFTPLACDVKGLHGRRRATHFYRGGRKATVKLTTRLGYRLEGTPEHRVWVRYQDGHEGWKCLGDLQPGDMLAIDRRVDLWGDQTHIPRDSRVYKRAQVCRLPEQLTPDLAYLMGLLIGDGTLTYTEGVLLSTVDQCIADEFRRIAAEQFGLAVGAKANGKDYSLLSVPLRAFFATLGLGYHRAHEKHVPQAILRAPKPIVAAFLQGLFDTDGSANNRYDGVQLSTASERLARELQLLLLNFGLIASLRVKQTPRRPAYVVSIYGADAISFHTQIGFRLPRKRARAALAATKRMPNIGGIPHLGSTLKSIQGRLAEAVDKPVALKRNKGVSSIFYTYLPNGRNISYAKLDELITFCDQSGVACPELWELRERHYFYDPIVTLAPSETEVYDLSVAEDHAYVANGIVSHNSTCLRQAALIVLMAQIGSFVPAERAEVGLVDRIFTRIGAQDDIATGQSTFMVEMTETAALLLQSSRRSLIILDEVGRGTSTYDGMAIARAVVEYIHNEPRLQCRTLFATHYHELTALESELPRVRNYHMAAVEQDGQVVFLHELRPGGADRSYGIHVAELAGIPRPVIARAGALLAELEGKAQRPPPAPRPALPDEDGLDEAPPTRQPIPVRATRPLPGARAAQARPTAQLSLFEAAPSPVLEYLRRLNLNELTPLEALIKLSELQKLAGRE
jgi:DNA mismatch repair protein MutS